MSERCEFTDGWLECSLDVGHDGLHEDHWLGGKPTPSTTPEGADHE
jgi:hypothetical protein